MPSPNSKSLEEQFSKLVEVSRPKMVAFARKLTRVDYEDLVQEAYLRAWGKFADFEPKESETKFSSWMFKILFRVFLTRLENEKKLGATAQEPASWDTLDGTELRLDLERAMAELNLMERAIVQGLLEGQTHAQISAARGRSKTFTLKRLKGVREKLAKHLK